MHLQLQSGKQRAKQARNKGADQQSKTNKKIRQTNSAKTDQEKGLTLQRKEETGEQTKKKDRRRTKTKKKKKEQEIKTKQTKNE